MIVETAAYYSHEKDQWAKSADQYSEFYPISTEGQRIFTHELVAELRLMPTWPAYSGGFPEEKCLRKYGDGRLAESGAFW